VAALAAPRRSRRRRGRLGGCHTPAVRLPPALAASATPRILDLLGEPPQRVLEVAFAGIHATPLRLAGFDVEVFDDDPRALERTGEIVHAPSGHYDAAVAPADADLRGVDAVRIIRVDRTGAAFMQE
jgi:hypothetical protein